MKVQTSQLSVRCVVATAIVSVVLALPFQAAAWSTINNGLYGNEASGVQVRVGPLPGQSSGSVPQSLLSPAIISLSGYVEGVSGTLSVTTAVPVISGNSASIVSTLTVSSLFEGNALTYVINVTEIFSLQPDGSLVYSSSSDLGGVVQPETILERVSLGVGTESSPFIPPNANWKAKVILVIMPVLPNRPTNFDPPYARGFDYKVVSGRSERVEKVFAPKGFGKKIKVYAASSRDGRPKLVGTVASGRSLNLTKSKGLKGGAAFVRMEGMEPKPNLSKGAPYPIGFTFTNVSDGSAKVEVIPKKD